MGKKKTEEPESSIRPLRPALNPASRENQLTSLAVDLAERQLMDGTASSQIITHFLKLATEKEQLEREKLRKENELLKAKAEALQSQQRSEELFEAAIKAMSTYNGRGDQDDY